MNYLIQFHVIYTDPLFQSFEEILAWLKIIFNESKNFFVGEKDEIIQGKFQLISLSANFIFHENHIFIFIFYFG